MWVEGEVGKVKKIIQMPLYLYFMVMWVDGMILWYMIIWLYYL